jgi:ABC-type transporter Mla subunit MlaD
MNKRQIIASLSEIASILEYNEMFEDAFTLSNVKRKITSQIESNDINQVMSQVNALSNRFSGELEDLNRLFKRLQQEMFSQYGRDEEMMIRLTKKIQSSFEEANVTRKKLSGKVQEISSLSNNVSQNAQPESPFGSTDLATPEAPNENYSESIRNRFESTDYSLPEAPRGSPSNRF